jgi:hypothetical protein
LSFKLKHFQENIKVISMTIIHVDYNHHLIWIS